MAGTRPVATTVFCAAQQRQQRPKHTDPRPQTPDPKPQRNSKLQISKPGALSFAFDPAVLEFCFLGIYLGFGTWFYGRFFGYLVLGVLGISNGIGFARPPVFSTLHAQCSSRLICSICRRANTPLCSTDANTRGTRCTN